MQKKGKRSQLAKFKRQKKENGFCIKKYKPILELLSLFCFTINDILPPKYVCDNTITQENLYEIQNLIAITAIMQKINQIKELIP